MVILSGFLAACGGSSGKEDHDSGVENKESGVEYDGGPGGDGSGLDAEVDAEVVVPTETTMETSVSQWGITWSFDKAYPCGRFVNGDWFVVADSDGVVIVDIQPEPAGGRNGFEVDPVADGTNRRQPYDSREEITIYDPSLQPELPVTVYAGSSLVSTISNPDEYTCSSGWVRPEQTRIRRWNLDHCVSVAVLETAAVLTVLDEPPPSGSFRPPYVAGEKPIYSSKNLRRELLLSLPGDVRSRTPPSLSLMETHFQRLWLDHLSSLHVRRVHPLYNMQDYYAGISTAAGLGALSLLLDYPLEEKEKLLIYYVQVGIDLYGMIETGHYFHRHGNGRKMNILFAGLMLDHEGMLGMSQREFPHGHGFHEDCSTYYDNEGVPRWGTRHCIDPSVSDESSSYRTCCTSSTWVGTALAARLLGLMDVWDHPPFFDYIDRWMEEDLDYGWGDLWFDAMYWEYRDWSAQ